MPLSEIIYAILKTKLLCRDCRTSVFSQRKTDLIMFYRSLRNFNVQHEENSIRIEANDHLKIPYPGYMSDISDKLSEFILIHNLCMWSDLAWSSRNTIPYQLINSHRFDRFACFTLIYCLYIVDSII